MPHAYTGKTMTLSLDHVVIAVSNLEQAMADYRDLGFTVIYGGRHASGTTHNALICFRDGTYLELLASTGEHKSRTDAVDFSHLLEHGEGVSGYAFASDDLESDAAALRERGVNVDEVREGGRRRDDGAELRWKTAFIDGGMSPFLIQDVTPRNLRVPDDAATTTHANGAAGICAFVVVPQVLAPERLGWYARLLGMQAQERNGRYIFSLYPVHFALEASSGKTATRYRIALAGVHAAMLNLSNTHNVTFEELEDL
jgi:catechol 2,3-dioxygenase-like lactoylglutathione lyase family enzyme